MIKKAQKSPEIVLDPRKMRAVDAWYWANFSQIKLGTGDFTTVGHEWQIGPLQCDDPYQCFLKGAQLGLSTLAMLKTVHGHIYGRYPQGSIYVFPNKDLMSDFSKTRLNPIIYENDCVRKYVKSESGIPSIEAATVKRIGKSSLYLRSGHESGKIQGVMATSSALLSVSADRLVLDERDQMEDDMVALAMARIDHSSIREVAELSTPTIPDYGIDARFQASDQRVWMIKCEACGTETCLELEFPDCILERQDGTPFRACHKCKKEIFPANGHWVPLYPDRKTLVGWKISQLSSVFAPLDVIWRAYHDPRSENLTISQVYNSKLGMAYIEAENRLTKNDIFQCCGREPNGKVPRTVTAMGVDVGKDLHVVIGRPLKQEKAYKIDYVGRVENFNDLHDLVDRYDVRATVIDQGPETRKVREFQEAEDCKVFLCTYLDKLRVAVREDQKRGMLTVNRTEICDKTHEIFVKAGAIELPRRCAEIDQFALEMSNTAKQLEEDQKTGSKIYRYRKLGPDHYFHSVNYFLLACEDPAVKHPIPRAFELEAMGMGKSDRERNDWDPLHRN